MATSAPWQFELGGVLCGDGTNYDLISVKEACKPKSNDLGRLLADGDYQGPQFSGPLFIYATVDVRGTSEANLVTNVQALRAAWVASSTDIAFELNLPTTGARTCEGRVEDSDFPEYVEETVAGYVLRDVRLVFKAGTPTWT